MTEKIKIAVVDDQKLFRQIMISLLKEFKDFEIIIGASNAIELLEELKSKKADLILLDYKMPLMNGIEATEIIKTKYPETKVLILTMFEEENIIPVLIEKGANGFLFKGCDFEVVVKAIQIIKTKGYYFNEHFSKEMLNDTKTNKKSSYNSNYSLLTSRETEIVKLLCKQLTNKEIATKLFISSRTVDGHRAKILQKTNAKNITGIFSYAIKNNLLD